MFLVCLLRKKYISLSELPKYVCSLSSLSFSTWDVSPLWYALLVEVLLCHRWTVAPQWGLFPWTDDQRWCVDSCRQSPLSWFINPGVCPESPWRSYHGLAREVCNDMAYFAKLVSHIHIGFWGSHMTFHVCRKKIWVSCMVGPLNPRDGAIDVENNFLHWFAIGISQFWRQTLRFVMLW